jgi:hypothetical protein
VLKIRPASASIALGRISAVVMVITLLIVAGHDMGRQFRAGIVRSAS